MVSRMPWMTSLTYARFWLTTIFSNIIQQMVFSGDAESDVVNMCKIVGEQIKGLTGDYKELAPKARFFIMAIKEAMGARNGSAQEVAYLSFFYYFLKLLYNMIVLYKNYFEVE